MHPMSILDRPGLLPGEEPADAVKPDPVRPPGACRLCWEQSGEARPAVAYLLCETCLDEGEANEVSIVAELATGRIGFLVGLGVADPCDTAARDYLRSAYNLALNDDRTRGIPALHHAIERLLDRRQPGPFRSGERNVDVIDGTRRAL